MHPSRSSPPTWPRPCTPRLASVWRQRRWTEHIRLIVIDISDDKSNLQVFINPEITRKTGSCEGEEGCLSVPGIYETVTRAETVTVNALNLDGQAFELTADGLLAVCIQHEIDHLNGMVFVNHLSRLKQQRIKEKLLKQAKATA